MGNRQLAPAQTTLAHPKNRPPRVRGLARPPPEKQGRSLRWSHLEFLIRSFIKIGFPIAGMVNFGMVTMSPAWATVSAVMKDRLATHWRQATPQAIVELTSRIGARVAAQPSTSEEQPQPRYAQAVAER